MAAKPYDTEEISARVRAALKWAGIASTAEAAQFLGYTSASAFGNMARGESAPQPHGIYRLRAATGVSADWLILGDADGLQKLNASDRVQLLRLTDEELEAVKMKKPFQRAKRRGIKSEG